MRLWLRRMFPGIHGGLWRDFSVKKKEERGKGAFIVLFFRPMKSWHRQNWRDFVIGSIFIKGNRES
jgi:hypothetical protein